MLFTVFIFALHSSLCAAVTVKTFQLHTPFATATPTPIVQKNFTSTRTISIPLSHTQTPKPQFTPGWASHSAKPATGNASLSSDASLASGFGTGCCGWGGEFGWTGNGELVATMAGNCGPGLPLSLLDLNGCLSWDASSGSISCSTSGGFLSNSASGCRVFSPPSIWGNAFSGSTYTQIFIVCNGPAANTGYITELDLNGCIGVTSSGQLTC
ncbi:hypothetical protein CPB84DRAFT_1801498 [Gymnopilus junonius]|uniref:Cyanovirin-N domain-containing protein n=1 Tax=Gymnopilus junonius TaxID=109634 RepID=A0A9P5N7W9_GYMJU|nr:hypothetical protein CPB84DRAFT_1801498 [Gymnopilus junonius]